MKAKIKNIPTLIEEAQNSVDDITVEQAKKLYQNSDYIFVDVRESDERRQSGIIPGAFTCPRGMLEFLIDPNFPAHNEIFSQDKTYVFYCARGLRSLFAAKQASDMGLKSVKNLAGGFLVWEENKGEIKHLN